jgi:hypothetical protein
MTLGALIPGSVQRLSRTTRWLLLFVPLACLALDLLLPHLPATPRRVMTSLDYTQLWMQRDPNHFAAAEDSWKPMRMAREWLGEAHEGRLYQEVFFERGVKLQYPPSSVLWLEALELLPGDSWTSNEALNAISWWAVLATILLSVAVFDRAATPPPGRERVLGERVLGWALVGAAGLVFYPLMRGFYLGQVQTWIDAGVAGLVLAFVAGRPATSGVLAGLVCLVKPQLGVLVLWGLLRGQRRFVVGWSCAVGVLGLLSLALYGFANHLDYLEVLSFIGRHGESFHPNQSVNGLLHRALGNGNNLRWVDAFPPFDARIYAATLLSSAGLLAAALFWRRSEAVRAPEIDLAIAIVTLTIASPVAWIHHYAVLLPLFALVLPRVAESVASRRALAWMLAGSFLLVSNTYRVTNRFAETPWSFLQSYVFFGGLLFLALLYRLRGLAARAS